LTAVDFAQLFAMFTLRLSHALCQSDTIEQRTPKGPFMPLLSLQQVLALTGTPFPKFQTLRRRDQIAMAVVMATLAVVTLTTRPAPSTIASTTWSAPARLAVLFKTGGSFRPAT
jgi:hypothetical protein